MRPQGTSRREFFILATAAGVALAIPRGLFAFAEGANPNTDPDACLKQLLDGNQKFAKGSASGPGRSPADVRGHAEGQHPKAVIITCSDSRVSPELLFDQGVGDVFVIRVAGNVVSCAPVEGSIEYGIAELGAPLIVVLGHSGCGAVKAALQQAKDNKPLPGDINDLVQLVKPAVAQSKAMPGDPLANAIRKNVELGVAKLKGLEPLIAPRVREGKVKVVGGVYDLKTGLVTMVG